MAGGQTSTTNSDQVATKSPYAPAIPGLQTALDSASNLYSSGVGSGVYSGQRVADLTTPQVQGIESTVDQANSDNAGAQGVSYLQNTMASNGISPTTQTGLNMLANVQGVDTSGLQGLGNYVQSGSNPINQTANAFMSGANNIQTSPLYAALFGAASQPTSAQQNLSAEASGALLNPTTDPYLQAALTQANQNASNATKEAYAASGRYGSGNFAGAMTKNIADIDTTALQNQYNTALTNQLSANQQIDTANQNQLNLGNTIANSLTNVASLNNQQKLAGAGLGVQQEGMASNVLGQVLGGNEFNSNLSLQQANDYTNAGLQGSQIANQAASAIPSVDASRYTPASNLLQVGSVEQGQNQNQLQAAQDYYNALQQTPWQALSEYASFPLAIGSQGGTQVTQGTQQTQTSGPSIGQTLLGGGLGLLSLGTGGGSTLGGGILKGLLTGSDERMKEDVRRIGELEDGQPIYSYRYKGDDRTQIGLLAQEVAEKQPDAVGPIGIGDLMGVDYGRATDDAARLAAKAGKKGSGDPSGGSAPPAAPPAGRPGVTIMVEGHSPHDPQAAALSQGLGAFAASMMAGGMHPGAGGGMGSMMQAALQAMTPQEAEPIRTGAPKPPARGKRRAAA